MRKIIILLITVQTFSLSAQEIFEKEIVTEIGQVTVFLDHAQITRNNNVSVHPGKTILKFISLSPFIQPKSIQVKVEGNVTVLSVNHQQNYLDSIDKPVKLADLESRYESVEKKIAREQAHISVIDEEIIFLQENRKIGGRVQELSVTTLKEASEFYGTRMTALKLKRIERTDVLKDLREELQRIRNQINSLTTKKEFPSGEILVTLDSESSEKISVELSYLVKNAGWFPSYDIRAKSIEDPVEIVYKANVHQDTKVDWMDVELTFSSSDPGQSGIAPELKPYFLNYNSVPPTYQSNIQEVSGKVLDREGNPLPGANVVVSGTTIGTIADMEGNYSIAIPSGASSLQVSYIGYATREVPVNRAVINLYLEKDVASLDEIVVTGYGSEEAEVTASLQRKAVPVSATRPAEKQAGIRGASSLSVPTVRLENQTTVEFSIDMPYSIKSDSRNYMVDMTSYEVPASYEYYCVPKIDEEAFLLAYVTDWEQYDFMEGEANIFFEDTYTGKSILDVRYVSDTLTLSLGRDKNVIVSREKIKDLTSRRFIGTKKEETRAWRISVRNNKKESIRMRLLDQVPIPTLEEIELDIQDLSGGKGNKDTGEITWDIRLDPNETEEVELKYSLKYPRHQNLLLE